MARVKSIVWAWKDFYKKAFIREHEYFEPIEADIRGFNNSKDKS